MKFKKAVELINGSGVQAIVNDILEGTEKFVNESGLPVTFSRSNALEHITLLLNHPDVEAILSYKDGKLAGFAGIRRYNDAHHEYLGDVMKLYVMPEFRGKGIGRELFSEIVEWFDDNDCVISFVEGAAAIGNDKMFANLAGKFGYKPLGTCLARLKNNVK